MIRPSRRTLSLVAGAQFSPRTSPPRLSRLTSHDSAPFARFLKAYTTKASPHAGAHIEVGKAPDDAMKPLQDASFDSIRSATTRSSASDADSDDSFGSSIFDGIDDLAPEVGSQNVDNPARAQGPSLSDSKSLAAVQAEEQAEAPYVLRFGIPSPPPPVDGIQSDPPRFWTHKLYRDSDGKAVRVLYCADFRAAEEHCKRFLKEKVVGFDMEWESYATAKDPIKKNIGVIQVCSESTVAIFHIALFHGGNNTKELIPPSLITLIESEDIIKTGVAVWQADGLRIRRFLKLNPRGFVELSHFFHVLQNNRSASGEYLKNLASLAKQVETYTGLSLPKGAARRSSWLRRLNQNQIDYAAADAYAGLMLYHIMNERRKQLRPAPPHPRFVELGLPIEGAKEDKKMVAKNDPLSTDDDSTATEAAEKATEIEQAAKKVAKTGLLGTDSTVTEAAEKATQPKQTMKESVQCPPAIASDIKGARRQLDTITTSEEHGGKNANEVLVDSLQTSELSLRDWKIGLTGKFTLLSRHQVGELIARFGGTMLRPRMKRLDLVIAGVSSSHHHKKKLQLLYENRIPVMAEADFYQMIRRRDLIKYSTESPTPQQQEHLGIYIGKLFERVCKATGRTPISLGLTITKVCREMPKTVTQLRKIDHAFFLYTILKSEGYDLLRILHQTKLPRSGAVRVGSDWAQNRDAPKTSAA